MTRRAFWWVGIGTLLVGVTCDAIWQRNGPTAIDPLATVAVGRRPAALALDDRTGRAFAVNNLDNTISVLDTHRGQLVRTLSVRPYGLRPALQAIAVDTRIGRAYAAGSGFTFKSPTSAFVSTVVILDTRRAGVVKSVSLPGLVRGVAVDDRTGRVFVLVDGNAMNHGDVAVLDATTGGLLRTVPVGASPVALAVDDRAGRLLVVNQGMSTSGSLTIRGTVSVLDARNGQLVRSVTVGQRPMDVAIDARTGRAFISNSVSDTISVIDTRGGRVLATVAAGRQPDAMAVDEQAGHLFVTNVAANTVSMLDARGGAFLRTVHVGLRPLVATVDTRTHRVLVANDVSGTATVLDSATGLVVRTVRVGLDPVDAAVDERTGRAFVLNLSADGARPSSLPLVNRIRALVGRIVAGPAREPTGSVNVIDMTR